MGRCGSVSIYDELCKHFKNVEKCHSLVVGRYDFLKKNTKRFISEYKKNNNYKFICTYREPVSHLVSWVFFRYSMRNSVIDILSSFKSCKNFFDLQINEYLDVGKASGLYFDDFINFSMDFFDKDMNPALDIDVYNYKFDHKKNHVVVPSKYGDVLIYKFEDMENISSVVNDFLGIDDFKLIKSNSNFDRKFFHVYKEFLDKYKFDKRFLNIVYNSKYVKHFYSDEEVKKFYERWGKDSCC